MAPQKKYICAFCARAFTRSEHKQRHERSHTNEKPFHCLYCTSSFVRRDLLQRHSRTVHNSQLNPKLIPSNKSLKSPPSQPSELDSYPMTPSNSNDSIKKSKSDPDMVHLLSIVKKLQSLLITYDSCDFIVDQFLIGYTHINTTKLYSVFDKISKDLMYYLSTFYINDHHELINDFKIGITYSIISLGHVLNFQYKQSIKFFKKSWNLLIKKLIPQYNHNNNPLDQIEILNNLFLLSYIYLYYDFQNHNINDESDENVYLTNQVILNYLNDISSIIINNLNELKINDSLIDSNMDLFFAIYILLSNHLVVDPPKIYHFILSRTVYGSTSLQKLMVHFTKSFMTIEDQSLKMLIVSTLSNELKLSNQTKLNIYDSRNSLHNSIILINKSINNLHNDHELFKLFKKNLIMNCPVKYQELINNYIFIPEDYLNWQLLKLTLYECQCNINSISNELITKSLNSTSSIIEIEIKNFFNYNINLGNINNNFLIASLPIIFLSDFLNLKMVKSDYNQLQRVELNVFFIQWYIISIKMLIIIFDESMREETRDNYIFQLFIYLINNHELIDQYESDKFHQLKSNLDSILDKFINFFSFGGSLSQLRQIINSYFIKSKDEVKIKRSNSINLGSLYNNHYNYYPPPLPTTVSNTASQPQQYPNFMLPPINDPLKENI